MHAKSRLHFVHELGECGFGYDAVGGWVMVVFDSTRAGRAHGIVGAFVEGRSSGRPWKDVFVNLEKERG